jgi:osmotically-inducible protein OsmY
MTGVGVLNQAREILAAVTLEEQLGSRRTELAYASGILDAIGGVEERAKDMLKIQQSDPLGDAIIADQVKAVVRRDPDVRTVDVVIFVSGGVVTLSGTVSTSHQRSRTERLASEVEGVTAAVNEIVVSNVRR